MKFIKKFLSALMVCSIITAGVSAVSVNAGWKSYVQPSSVTQFQTSRDYYIRNFINDQKHFYPDGSYWNNGGVTDTPCNHTGYLSETCNKFTVQNILKANYHILADPPNQYVNTPGNEYYQCYGFALQMASDLFKTASFNIMYYSSLSAISESGTYEPRVGDVVRINNQTHSIFITSVDLKNGYVTYADCNSDGKTCIIKWDQRKTVDSLQESSTMYVYRPMMCGDLNNNSIIDENDYTILQALIDGTEPYYKTGMNGLFRCASADINCDGVIDQNDAESLRRVLDGATNGMYYLGYEKYIEV